MEKEELRELLKSVMSRRVDPRTAQQDEYLTAEDREAKERSERGPGARRACADCTCGRKEENAPQTRSACGNCYKGDAFRCSGCPSLGMPPYSPGDVVSFEPEDEF